MRNVAILLFLLWVTPAIGAQADKEIRLALRGSNPTGRIESADFSLDEWRRFNFSPDMVPAAWQAEKGLIVTMTLTISNDLWITSQVLATAEFASGTLGGLGNGMPNRTIFINQFPRGYRGKIIVTVNRASAELGLRATDAVQ